MSRAAYEAHFGQAAPDGAIFGVDVSWYQAASGDVLDYGTCAGYWADFGTWAAFVCIRTSYGAGGDDGAEDLHFQLAAERGYAGALGTYHFVGSNRTAAANAANYLAQSDRFVGRTTFDMLDFEAAPIAPGAYVSELCDRVQQARQRPCLIYGGKGYLDASGAIACPADRLWVPHYASGSSNAWVPTTDWSSWDAPLMPNQFAGQYPGVWQWSSLTPQHGSLDLNISTTPDAFGGSLGAASEEDDLTPDQAQQLAETRQLLQDVIWHLGNFVTTPGREEETISSRMRAAQGSLNDVIWHLGNFLPEAGREAETVSTRMRDVQSNVAHLVAVADGQTPPGTEPPAKGLDEYSSVELFAALGAALAREHAAKDAA